MFLGRNARNVTITEEKVFILADQGGMNNIRMSAETAVAMAYTMKRTLVLPPIRAINAMDKVRTFERRSESDVPPPNYYPARRRMCRTLEGRNACFR